MDFQRLEVSQEIQGGKLEYHARQLPLKRGLVELRRKLAGGVSGTLRRCERLGLIRWNFVDIGLAENLSEGMRKSSNPHPLKTTRVPGQNPRSSYTALRRGASPTGAPPVTTGTLFMRLARRGGTALRMCTSLSFLPAAASIKSEVQRNDGLNRNQRQKMWQAQNRPAATWSGQYVPGVTIGAELLFVGLFRESGKRTATKSDGATRG